MCIEETDGKGGFSVGVLVADVYTVVEELWLDTHGSCASPEHPRTGFFNERRMLEVCVVYLSCDAVGRQQCF